jgi:ABC-type nitrate/sulfonate/bicarbonate transport system permease component
MSFTVLVGAKLAGTLAGPGYLIQMSALSFRIDNIFVGAVVLAVFGSVADLAFIRVLYSAFPGYRVEQSGKIAAMISTAVPPRRVDRLYRMLSV